MRKAFVNSLIKLAETDNKIVLLTGDLGFSFVEPFAEKFPSRFKNCGICEQSMVGIAAGMALLGWKPYVYSISTILLSRAYEQIRDEVCYQNLNVKLIGTGASIFLGFTHNVQNGEDMKIINPLPNIIAYRPGTPEDVEKVVLESYENKKPTYIRL